MCASDEDESPSVCTREREYFEIRIVRTRPRCACSCPEPDPQLALLDDKCKCVNPEHKCYVDHYAGKCGCDCEDCAKCDCDCVLLARLDRTGDDPEHPVWTADHRVRRFVRPVLMRDPQVEIEHKKREEDNKAVALLKSTAAAPAAAPASSKTPKSKISRKPTR